MSIAPGTRFGPYELLALLGAGGMGEVYRARDGRLGRDVALKVLPAAVCTDRDRLRRFEQEAKAAGALNHPNVVAIHDVGAERGQPFLVSELLEGETLRERLGRGPLSPRRAIEIAAQIAHGLAAAHARGILHRDLKPENLFLTRDGRAKILDFGIAKLTQPDASDLPDAPTATGVRETEAGAVVGTVGYMAPEQVQGRNVDQRSDLFALGAVFYEMLAGARAFTGTSRIGTLNAILETDPKDLPATVPTPVQRIVRRCLEKDPDARFQSARDLAFALDSLTSETSAKPPTSLDANRRRGLALLALTCLGVGAAVGYGVSTFGRSDTSAPRHVKRFIVQPPANGRLAPSGLVRLSPDGTRLLYEGSGPAGPRLYLRQVDRFDAEPLAGTEAAGAPFHSPDGQWIGFAQGTSLRKVPSIGGASTLICDIGSPAGVGSRGGFLGGTWGPDGTIIFARNSSGLLSVSSDGGAPVQITQPDPVKDEIDHHTPELLPGGHAILFTIHAGPEVFRVAVRSLETGEQRTLLDDGFAARYVPTGHIVFARGDRLLAASFDVRRLEITGPEVPVVENVWTVLGGGWALFDIAQDGTLAYVPAPARNGRTLAWVNRTGGVESLSLFPARAYESPRISPDGQRLALEVTESTRREIWIYRMADGAGTRLSLEGANSRPQWTPDGRHLAISSRRGDERFLITQIADGSAAGELLVRSRQHDLWAGAWTPDAQTLLFVENPPAGISDIKLVRRHGAAAEPFISGPTANGGPALSPDGRWVAYRSSDSGRVEVYLRPFPGLGVPRQITTDGGGDPVWARHGREVFYLNNDRMFAIPVRTTPTLDVGKPRVLFTLPFSLSAGARPLAGSPDFDVMPDGQRFIMVKPADDELAPRSIHIVENWFEELKRRVRPNER